MGVVNIDSIKKMVSSDVFETLLYGAIVLGLISLMAMVIEQQKRIEALEMRPPVTSYRDVPAIRKPCGCIDVAVDDIAKASAEVANERSDGDNTVGFTDSGD